MRLAEYVSGQVREFCASIGSEPRLVQGAGGNFSEKRHDGSLQVTASGKRLSAAQTENIFVCLAPEMTTLDFSRPNPPEMMTAATGVDGRPSIEWSLHALLPSRYVLHLHPVDVLATVVRKDWQDLLREKTLRTFDVRLVDYAKPGWHLARMISEQGAIETTEVVLFLQNHGLVVGADTLEDLERVLFSTLEGLRTEPESPVSMELLPRLRGWRPAAEPVHRLARDEKIWHVLPKIWALYPDHVVFLGSKPRVTEAGILRSTDTSLEPGRSGPLFVKGRGVLVPADFSRIQEEMLLCFHEVIARQDTLDLLNPLSPGQVEELVNWDAEKHRIKLSVDV